MKKSLTIALLGIVAVVTYVVTVRVSALVEKKANEREQERLKNEFERLQQMASGGGERMGTPAHTATNGGHGREPTLQSLVAEARTILLCEHHEKAGSIRCHMTRVLQHDPDVSFPLGAAIPGHERRLIKDEAAAEGALTFVCSPPMKTSYSFFVLAGRVIDVGQDFDLAEVITLIDTANTASHGTALPRRP